MFCMLNNLESVAKAQHVRNWNKNEPQPAAAGHTSHHPHSRWYTCVTTA